MRHGGRVGGVGEGRPGAAAPSARAVRGAGRGVPAGGGEPDDAARVADAGFRRRAAGARGAVDVRVRAGDRGVLLADRAVRGARQAACGGAVADGAGGLFRGVRDGDARSAEPDAGRVHAGADGAGGVADAGVSG